MNRSGMGRDKVKTSVATLPCSVTLEGLTKPAKRFAILITVLLKNQVFWETAPGRILNSLPGFRKIVVP